MRKCLVVVCLLLFVACIEAGSVYGQAGSEGLRISDADLDFREPVKPLVVEAMTGERETRLVRRNGGLVKRTAYFRGKGGSILEEAVYEESTRYNIDPRLVWSLVWQESGARLNAVSPKLARGPLQLMPGTARRFGVKNPHDPKEAVRGGVAYLVWLLDRFGGNVALALAAYNSGEASVDAYLTGRTIVLKTGKVINRRGLQTGGIPPYEETENYVRRIAGLYREARREEKSSVEK